VLQRHAEATPRAVQHCHESLTGHPRCRDGDLPLRSRCRRPDLDRDRKREGVLRRTPRPALPPPRCCSNGGIVGRQLPLIDRGQPLCPARPTLLVLATDGIRRPSRRDSGPRANQARGRWEFCRATRNPTTTRWFWSHVRGGNRVSRKKRRSKPSAAAAFGAHLDRAVSTPPTRPTSWRAARWGKGSGRGGWRPCSWELSATSAPGPRNGPRKRASSKLSNRLALECFFAGYEMAPPPRGREANAVLRRMNALREEDARASPTSCTTRRRSSWLSFTCASRTQARKLGPRSEPHLDPVRARSAKSSRSCAPFARTEAHRSRRPRPAGGRRSWVGSPSVPGGGPRPRGGDPKLGSARSRDRPLPRRAGA